MNIFIPRRKKGAGRWASKMRTPLYILLDVALCSSLPFSQEISQGSSLKAERPGDGKMPPRKWGSSSITAKQDIRPCLNFSCRGYLASTRKSPHSATAKAVNTLKSGVRGFNIVITDFAVWNLFIRVPLIFRGVVCLVTTEEINLPGQIALLKYSSIFLEAFRWNRALRLYGFPYDQEFSRSFALFGRPASPPWIFGPELRRFCVEHRRDIDVLLVNEKEAILLWPGQNPDRFPSLVAAAIGIMLNLCESVPDSDCKVS